MDILVLDPEFLLIEFGYEFNSKNLKLSPAMCFYFFSLKSLNMIIVNNVDNREILWKKAIITESLAPRKHLLAY